MAIANKRNTRRAAASPWLPKKMSRARKPEGMSLAEWQVALRREFGREQKFQLENIGSEPVFSEFLVTNPETGGSYRVAIRGVNPGDNYCSCPDFAVNTLGTCKHVEFTLGRLQRQRGYRAALAQGFRPRFSEVYLRYGPKREVMFGPGAECPEWLLRLASRYFDERGILKPDAYAHFDTFVKEAGKDGHEVRCYEDAIRFVAQVRDNARRQEIIAHAFPQGAASPAFDKLIKTSLYPYQREGALFAANVGRCLLADDMGLGKTVQAIAATEILAQTVGVERVLIIAPTSLKHQWKDEIERFTGRTAVVVEGLQPARAERYAAESFYKIANYDIVHRDMDRIRAWAPDLIILDEAQRIKNWKTLTAKSVKKLPSEYAIVLTGTPLENRLEELHSIVEFVDRFRLGPSFRFLAEHQQLDGYGKVVGYRNLSRISTTLKPILVRRTKSQVLRELPERLEKRFFVDMTKEQMNHHEENKATVARIVAKWRRYGFLSETDQRLLMIALQYMRMSCNSTYLLDPKTDHGVKADELMALLGEIFEQPDEKVVVFSQWVRTHELIAGRLDARGWRYVLFHGGVPGPKRKDLIRQFKEDTACRLFLSTDAGGVGLNLQNAAVVINMDQPWNPAVLEQRVGRVHRLGQHRPVRVVHFIAQGTIEHGMLSLLSFKKSLFAGVLDGGEDEVFLGGTKLKRFMESVEKVSQSIPAAMPSHEAQAAESAAAAKEEAADEEARAAQVASPQQQAWTDLLATGLSFLDKLGQALQAGKGAPTQPFAAAIPSLIERDSATGQPYLRLPIPKPEVLQKVVDLLSALTGKS